MCRPRWRCGAPSKKKELHNERKGMREMDILVKKTLEKQLQLLSERSESVQDNRELVALTNAMALISRQLLDQA